MMDLEARHTEFFLGIVGIIGGELADAGKSPVGGNGLAVLAKHFHHLLGEPDSEFLTDLDKGNRIEVFLHLYVTIGMDFGPAPLAHLKPSGWQSLQIVFLLLETLGPANPVVLHH